MNPSSTKRYGVAVGAPWGEAVERELWRGARPDRVYTHYHSDLNLDHRRVCEAVLVATRGICPVWMARPEWPSRVMGPAWQPNQSVDISAFVEQKAKACACYTHELREWPHPRSLQAVKADSTEWFYVVE